MTPKIRKGFYLKKRLIRKRLIKTDLPDPDDNEPYSPKDDGEIHVNWADDLEKIFDGDHYEQIHFTKIPKSGKPKFKSILKKTKLSQASHLSETECSSSCSDFENPRDIETARSLFRPKKKSVTSPELNQMKDLPSYNYRNKKLLSQILTSKKRRFSCFSTSGHSKLSGNATK